MLGYKFRVSAKVVFGPDAVAQLPAELAMHDGCTPTNPHPIDETGFSALFAQGLDGGMS